MLTGRTRPAAGHVGGRPGVHQPTPGVAAAGPEQAARLYEVFVEAVRSRGVGVETGRFRAHMDVELVNDGPVTLLLDSGKVV